MRLGPLHVWALSPNTNGVGEPPVVLLALLCATRRGLPLLELGNLGGVIPDLSGPSQ